jgi:hypothetical protein
METSSKKPRKRRPRLEPNPLREWLERHPPPMSKRRFADLIDVTDAFVSMLIADDPPWPGRVTIRKIAEVTKGVVDANVMAGYAPPEESTHAAR